MDKSLNAVFCGNRRRRRGHTVIFSEINLAVHQRIREVTHIRVGGNGSVLPVRDFVNLAFVLWDFSLNVLDGVMKQLRQRYILIGFAGGVETKACAFHFHLAQNHLWVLHKIAVHRNAVLIGIKVYPIWLDVCNAVTLLQKENVARNLCACVCPESVVWQSDSSEQLGSLGNIFAYFGACLIHCSLRGNERNDTACTDFIKSLCEKVVVNEELLGVVSAVVDLEISKRHIADNHIKVVVWELCFFKALHGNIRFLIELLCDFSRKGVDFHTVELRACHRIG